MSNEYKKDGNPQFDITDRGFRVQCWYLADTKANALIEITREGQSVRTFLFPAYKIWNIAAHFGDIVDSEIAKDINGYAVAASTGFGGSVPIREL